MIVRFTHIFPSRVSFCTSGVVVPLCPRALLVVTEMQHVFVELNEIQEPRSRVLPCISGAPMALGGYLSC